MVYEITANMNQNASTSQRTSMAWVPKMYCSINYISSNKMYCDVLAGLIHLLLPLIIQYKPCNQCKLSDKLSDNDIMSVLYSSPSRVNNTAFCKYTSHFLIHEALIKCTSHTMIHQSYLSLTNPTTRMPKPHSIPQCVGKPCY